MKLFIDTWGWIVLRNKREPMHTDLSKFYFSWRNQRGVSYTTDYILDETFTLLFRRLSFKEAKESLDVIDLAIREGYLRLERITAERFEKAKRLRIKFQDKPRISFTDLSVRRKITYRNQPLPRTPESLDNIE
ncbi:MAG: nucleic acid-binding protein [Euryarchaeota archaeon]|nr:nucleic acid-binding protein [Euryarchaeota archaeon]